MDSLFAIKGKDFILVVSETTVMHSIFKLKKNQSKTYKLDDKIILSLAGDNADRDKFGSLIERNIQFLKFKNNNPLTVHEVANFTRTKLAELLRKQPYQVNSLVSGWDSKGPQLYWMDYLGTIADVEYGSHGYAAYFVNSILSNSYKPGLNLEDCIQIAKQCVNELRTRFLMSQDQFMATVIDQNGVREFDLKDK